MRNRSAGRFKPIFRRLWVRILIGLFGLALIIIGLARLGLSEPPETKVPGEFAVRLNDMNVLINEIYAKQLHLVSIIGIMSAKEGAADYAGAAESAADALTRVDGLTPRANLLGTKITEFEALAGAAAYPGVKTGAAKLAGLLKDRNAILLKFLDDERQILELERLYYEDLAAAERETPQPAGNKPAPTPDEETLGVVTDKIAQLEKEISEGNKAAVELNDAIQSAYREFTRTAGLRERK